MPVVTAILDAFAIIVSRSGGVALSDANPAHNPIPAALMRMVLGDK
jgi:hypothetical protein